MERLIGKIERLVLLENEIGLLLKKIDCVRLAKDVSYLNYLEREIAVKEEILEEKREELYAAYEKLATILQVDDKLDKILVIFDLIDRKEMSIESGR